MGVSLPADRRDDLRQQMALGHSGVLWDRLSNALLDAMGDGLERSLLPPDEVERLRELGCRSAGEAALWRIRDSLDPAHNAKFLSLLIQSLPKRQEMTRVNVDLKDMSLTELLTAGGVDIAEVEVEDVRSGDTPSDSSS